MKLRSKCRRVGLRRRARWPENWWLCFQGLSYCTATQTFLRPHSLTWTITMYVHRKTGVNIIQLTYVQVHLTIIVPIDLNKCTCQVATPMSSPTDWLSGHTILCLFPSIRLHSLIMSVTRFVYIIICHVSTSGSVLHSSNGTLQLQDSKQVYNLEYKPYSKIRDKHPVFSPNETDRPTEVSYLSSLDTIYFGLTTFLGHAPFDL